MTDTFSEEKRSLVMKAVKSKDNSSTELKLIRIFKKLKITGWRRHYKLYGNPDFVFLKYRLAVFCDGCFWHGHDCRNTKPKANAAYWISKQERNKNRDLEVEQTLTGKNWKVVRLWECEIKEEIVKGLFEDL